MTWELEILMWIQNLMRFSWLKPLMVFVTSLGGVTNIWILIAVYLYFFRKDKKAALTVAVGLIFSVILCNLVVKNIFVRSRPFEVYPYVDLLVKAPTDYSFPSGHTSASFAAAVVLSYFYPKQKGWFTLLACLIAFSRLFLFVHFPTDVLAGAVFGISCGLLAIECFQRGLLSKFE